MIALLLAVAFAMLLIPILGGEYRFLSHRIYRFESLIPLGLLFQVGGPLVLSSLVGVDREPAALISWLVGNALLLVACIANLRRRGFGLATLGISFNALVIVLNVGMPVSPAALSALGFIDQTTETEALPALYHLQNQSTRLAVLGDVLPLPGPSLVRAVVSLGDLLLMVGVALVILDAANSLFSYGTTHSPGCSPSPE